jgi:hypothetical protein
MFRERPMEAFVRCRRVDERVEEDHAVTLGKHNGLVLRDRTARGFRQSGHAEIGQFPPLKLRGAFDQSLRRLVDAKAQPLFSQTSVAHCRNHMVTFRSQCTSNGLTFQHLDFEREIRLDAGMLYDPNAFGDLTQLAQFWGEFRNFVQSGASRIK